jgi:hypothetical protein
MNKEMVRFPTRVITDLRLNSKERIFVINLYAKGDVGDEFLFTPFDYTKIMNKEAVTIRKYLQKAVETGYVSVRKVNDILNGRVMVKLLG